MPQFKVIVHETTELTYEIEANSVAEAYEIWDTTRDENEGGRGRPQEDLMGTECICIVDEHGTGHKPPSKLGDDAEVEGA